MRLLVLGSNGLLGSNVFATADARNHDVAGTFHSAAPSFDGPLHELDLRDRDRFESILDRTSPDAVVNCAAMTDVDGCETDPDAAQAINGEAPGRLAAVCERAGVRFVHVSTDYVFDGSASTPYDEDAATGPVQSYGESKLLGERRVREWCEDALIARLSFVYGVHRSTGELTGFPRWVRDRLDATETVPLFTDQHVTPTRAGQAADSILSLLEAGASGTFHVACRSCVTPYEFGERVRRRTDAPERLLTEGSMDDVGRPATRPAYTCLDVETVGRRLGREQPTLAADLDATAGAFD